LFDVLEVKHSRVVGNNLYLVFMNEEFIKYKLDLMGINYKLTTNKYEIHLSVYSNNQEIELILNRNFEYTKESDGKYIIERKKEVFIKTYKGFFTEFISNLMDNWDYYDEKFYIKAESVIKNMEIYNSETYEILDIDIINNLIDKYNFEAEEYNNLVIIQFGYSDYVKGIDFTNIIYKFLLDFYIYYNPQEFKCDIICEIDNSEVIRAYIQNRGFKFKGLECIKEEERTLCKIKNLNQDWITKFKTAITRDLGYKAEINIIGNIRNPKNQVEITINNNEPLSFKYKTYKVLNRKDFIKSLHWLYNNLEGISKDIEEQAYKYLEELSVL